MGRKRYVDKHIMALLEKHKGRGFIFGGILRGFAKHGKNFNQVTLWHNLGFLIEQEKIVKVDGDTRPFYGIPLTREDGSRYLIVNQGFIDEELEVE